MTIEHLFVYGSLTPGQPNEKILSAIKGEWSLASVRGYLKQAGWGSKMGYPGIILDKAAKNIAGFLFSSTELSNHWKVLDDFEGEGYKRVLTEVQTEEGVTITAYIYVLSMLTDKEDQKL